MDDWDATTRGERLREADLNTDQAAAAAGGLTAAAFIAPWALLSFALPAQWRWKALALLALLGLLLALTAMVAERLARARQLDVAWWSFLAVVTFGAATLALYKWKAGYGGNPQFVCHGCGRLGDAREPFCFGCGTY